MKLPNEINADSFKHSQSLVEEQFENGSTWHIARPMKMDCLCLFKRVRLAWLVFTGRRDALRYWEDK